MPQIFVRSRKGGSARLSYICVIKRPEIPPFYNPIKKNNDFFKKKQIML